VCDLLALHALIKKSSEFEQETFSVESFELKLDADMELDDWPSSCWCLLMLLSVWIVFVANRFDESLMDRLKIKRNIFFNHLKKRKLNFSFLFCKTLNQNC